MRTISADDAARLVSLERSVSMHVWVVDTTSTLRDLATYPGFNACQSATWGEQIDSNGMTCTVKLARAQAGISLAPFVSASPLNRAWDPASAYSPLLNPTQRLLVYWKYILPGESETWGASYKCGFDGYVDKIETDSETVTMTCRGLESHLMAPYAVFRREKIFGYAQGASATRGALSYVPRDAGDPYAVNELVIPSQDNLNAHYYKVTASTGATDLAIEPTWPTGAGSTVSSGLVTFTETGAGSPTAGVALETALQAMIVDCGSSVTLVTPVSPGWAVGWWLQKRIACFNAMRALTDQIGWDLRFMYNSGTNDFELRLINPPRSKTTPDYTFYADDLKSCDPVAFDVSGVRNVVQVVYSDSTDRDAGGFAKRKNVIVKDSASIAKWGELWIELAESSSSQIDTPTEASNLANIVLTDLGSPVNEWGVELKFFGSVELNDLYRFQPYSHSDSTKNTMPQFDSNLDLAVMGYTHEISAKGSTTKLTLRGKPCGGYMKWLSRDASTVAKDQGHQLASMNVATPKVVSIASTIGGLKATIDGTVGALTLAESREWYVSKNSSDLTTPSAAFKVQDSKSNALTLANLTPGQTYYVRTAATSVNAEKRIVQLPGPIQTFVAGQGNSGHLNSEVEWGAMPINGGFETQTDTSILPDHWSPFLSTVFGTDVQVSSTAFSGNKSIFFTTSTSPSVGLQSDFINVTPGQQYEFSAWVLKSVASGVGTCAVYVAFYNSAKSLVSSSNVAFDWTLIGTSTWVKVGGVAPTPSNGAFARVWVAKGTGADSFYVDQIRLVWTGDVWTALPFGATWSNVGGYTPASFRKDSVGQVLLKGLIVSTSTATTQIGTVPVGYRPTTQRLTCALSGGGASTPARVDIYANGQIWYVNGGAPTNFVSLDGLSWDTT